jgi:hypothetical protein
LADTGGDLSTKYCSNFCSISIKSLLNLNCKSTSSLFSPPPHYLNPESATGSGQIITLANASKTFPASSLAIQALFIWLIIRLIQLIFLAETVFFSHRKSANSVFQPAYNFSRTAPQFSSGVPFRAFGAHQTDGMDGNHQHFCQLNCTCWWVYVEWLN